MAGIYLSEDERCDFVSLCYLPTPVFLDTLLLLQIFYAHCLMAAYNIVDQVCPNRKLTGGTLIQSPAVEPVF